MYIHIEHNSNMIVKYMSDNRQNLKVPIIDKVCGLDHYGRINRHRLLFLLPTKYTDYYMYID